MKAMKLTVECYSCRKADEHPVQLFLDGMKHRVEAALDQWYEPESISYKVRGDDDNFDIIRHRTAILATAPAGRANLRCADSTTPHTNDVSRTEIATGKFHPLGTLEMEIWGKDRAVSSGIPCLLQTQWRNSCYSGGVPGCSDTRITRRVSRWVPSLSPAATKGSTVFQRRAGPDCGDPCDL
jgi:hypothetical protein